MYRAISIRDRIDSRLELCNKGAYDELGHNSHSRRKNIEGISAGPKPRSNGIVILKPCLKREISQSCPFYLWTRERKVGVGGGGCYLMTNRMKNQSLWIKLPWKYCQEKIRTTKTPMCCVGSVWGNSCFYPRGYYGRCGQVSFAKTFRELRAQCNGSRSLTGMATKIWGPQQENLCQCKIFCRLYSKKNHHGPPIRYLFMVAWLHWITSP